MILLDTYYNQRICFSATISRPTFDRSLKPSATTFPASNNAVQDSDVANQMSTAFAA